MNCISTFTSLLVPPRLFGAVDARSSCKSGCLSLELRQDARYLMCPHGQASEPGTSRHFNLCSANNLGDSRGRGRETHPAKKTSPPPASFLDFCDSVCNPRLVLFYPSFPLPNPPTLLRTLGLSPLYLLYQPKVFVQLIASTTAACGSSPTPGATSRLQNPPTAVLPSPLI